MSDWLTTQDVASRLNYTRKTVAAWCASGKIQGAQKWPDISPRSEWRIPAAWVEAQLNRRARREPVTRDRLDALMDAALAKTA